MLPLSLPLSSAAFGGKPGVAIAMNVAPEQLPMLLTAIVESSDDAIISKKAARAVAAGRSYLTRIVSKVRWQDRFPVLDRAAPRPLSLPWQRR